MIFITGDAHGEFNKLSAKRFPRQKGLTKSDYVIICGDFGVWDGSNREREWLRWLDEKRFTTLFVDGNHENFDLLDSCPVSVWNGGKAQYLSDSVIHLMRGQLYELDGLRIFTMGGASSHDIEDGVLDRSAPDFRAVMTRLNRIGGRYRINHESWWERELPSDAEYDEALKNLEGRAWRADMIISHCAPTSLLGSLGIDAAPDRLTDFLEQIKSRCEYDRWFFGHYHKDQKLDEKHTVLYGSILER